jgi:hypothetical protein
VGEEGQWRGHHQLLDQRSRGKGLPGDHKEGVVVVPQVEGGS